jgi:hypothetical protein
LTEVPRGLSVSRLWQYQLLYAQARDCRQKEPAHWSALSNLRGYSYCTHKHVDSNRRWREDNQEKAREQYQRFYAKHRDRVLADRKRWRQANQEKKRAHTAVRDALRSGRLNKQPCEVCGSRAEAHHEDYSKPLDVRWLCSKHHHRVRQ